MHPSGHTLARSGMVAAVVCFYIFSILFGGRPKTVNAFFHQRNLYFNITSLIASNFGLGLGLISALTFSHQFGALCFLFPLAMFLGQGFFSRLITRLDPERWCKRGTILSGLSDELDRAANREVHFQEVASIFILVTLIMALCYELYVSSEWLCIALLPTENPAGRAMVIAMLILIVMTYITTGGYRTTQITDCLQCAFALPFVGLVCYLLFSYTPQPDFKLEATNQWFPLPRGWIATISFGTAVLSPFTTQIYSALNQAFASHQGTNNEQRQLFLWARIGGIILNWTIVFFALCCCYAGGEPKGVTEQWLTWKTNSASLVIPFVTVAMVAMVLSTVDTLVMATAQSGFESYFHGDSRQEKGGRLTKLRFSLLLIYPLAFLIIITLLIVKPKILQLLYAMASPCEVLTPIIICLCFLARENRLEVILKPVVWKMRFIDFFYFLLAGTLVAAWVAILMGYQWSGIIGLTVFILSGALSYVVWLNRNWRLGAVVI
jgi:hypothetical protein